MKLNRKELRKIQYDFNSCSNRLLQANFQDYSSVLIKFVNYVETTPIIIEYIIGCGECTLDLENEVKEVQQSYGRLIFSSGDTDEEEVCNVFAILKHIADNDEYAVYDGIAIGYSSSTKYQDKVKGFNERFVMILIRHIERYLTKVGIDMGVDEKIIYNVTVNSGQAIIATDNANVTAFNSVGVDLDELQKLLVAVREKSLELQPDEQETVSDSLEAVDAEIKSEKPKKGLIKTALTALKGIKGTTEFAAAVTALIQFVTQFI